MEFDYSFASHTYRVTVLDRDVSSAAGALEPMTLASLFREVRANGTTVATFGRYAAEIAVLHASGLATVRANSDRANGGPDLMTPVNGWVAFATHDTSSGTPFGRHIDGLDAAGNVVTTALPWRCC